MLARWQMILSGRVQGIGLRFRAKIGAQQQHLTGWVSNRNDGDVELEVQGEPSAIEAFVAYLRSLPGAQITFIRFEELEVIPETQFRIR